MGVEIRSHSFDQLLRKAYQRHFTPYFMNYIIYLNDQERGPYPIDELIKSVNANHLKPSIMAREESSAEWMELSSVITQRQESQRQESQRQESQRQESQAIASKEIEIKPFEAPYIVGLHYVVAGMFFIVSLFCLIGVAGKNSSQSAAALNLLIICISSGIALIVAGYIISCLAECAFRLRNIELNTAKAAEKN